MKKLAVLLVCYVFLLFPAVNAQEYYVDEEGNVYEEVIIVEEEEEEVVLEVDEEVKPGDVLIDQDGDTWIVE